MVGKREFEGKDLETALHTAANALGVAEPELDYEIVEPGRRGLFGVGAKSVRIRVMPPLADAPDPMAAAELHLPPEIRKAANKRRRREGGGREGGNNKRRDPQKRDPQKRDPQKREAVNREAKVAKRDGGERADRKKRNGGSRRRRRRREAPRERSDSGLPRPVLVADGPPPEGSEAIVATLQQMLDLSGIELKARALGSTQGVIVELEGSDREMLTEKDAELMPALQFLLNRMARRAWPDAGRIQLTCEGQHSEDRDDELVELTREVAQQVGSTGKTKRLHPMNAYERRLVHLTVREFEELGSRSEGNGHLKRVKIYKQQTEA